MKTIEIETYKFNELSPEARKRAMEWFREANRDWFDTKGLTEDFLSQLEEKFGLRSAKKEPLDCYWSLNCCQGDGVAFYGRLDVPFLAEKNEDIRKIVERMRELDSEVDVNVELQGHSNRYHHWNSMTISLDVRWFDGVNGDVAVARESELEAVIDKLAKNASRALESDGYEWLEFLDSDEQVIEGIEANEFDFTIDGNRSVIL